MIDVQNEPWFKDPFGWYEDTERPELIGVQLTNNVALDFMHGLHDVYLSFKEKHYDSAIHNLEILAKLLIAGALDLGAQVIDQLLVEEFDDIDIDEAFIKLTKEIEDGK